MFRTFQDSLLPQEAQAQMQAKAQVQAQTQAQAQLFDIPLQWSPPR